MRKLLMMLMVMLLSACGTADTPEPTTDAAAPVSATPVLVEPTIGAVEPTSATGGQAMEVEPVPVDSVSVGVLESFPVQIQVNVAGYLPNGCVEISEMTQNRTGNTVEVTILGAQPVDAMCTMEIRSFEEVIMLEGEFESGTYTVIVNGVEATFTV